MAGSLDMQSHEPCPNAAAPTGAATLATKWAGVMPIDLADPQRTEDRYKSIVDALLTKRQIAVSLEITSSCNLHCSFCAMHKKQPEANGSNKIRRKPFCTMSVDSLKELIEKFNGLPPLKILNIAGHGEPLLHPRVEEIIYYIKTKGISERTVLFTNGILLDPRKLVAITDAGIDEVRVSLDAITPEVYLKVKGMDRATTVRRNVENCLRTIREHDLQLRFCIECMHWNTGDKQIDNETLVVIEYFNDLVVPIHNAVIRVHDTFQWINQIDGNHHANRILPCEQPFFHTLIHADGDVSCCCVDLGKEHVVGNVFNAGHFREILQGKDLARIRKLVLMQDFENLPLCQFCDFRSTVDRLLLERRSEILRLMEN